VGGAGGRGVGCGVVVGVGVVLVLQRRLQRRRRRSRPRRWRASARPLSWHARRPFPRAARTRSGTSAPPPLLWPALLSARAFGGAGVCRNEASALFFSFARELGEGRGPCEGTGSIRKQARRVVASVFARARFVSAARVVREDLEGVSVCWKDDAKEVQAAPHHAPPDACPSHTPSAHDDGSTTKTNNAKRQSKAAGALNPLQSPSPLLFRPPSSKTHASVASPSPRGLRTHATFTAARIFAGRSATRPAGCVASRPRQRSRPDALPAGPTRRASGAARRGARRAARGARPDHLAAA
jgi:hypothetical protein